MLYLLFSVILGAIPVNKDYQPLQEGIEIWIVRDAMHTEIIIPSQTDRVNWLNYLKVTSEQQHLYDFVSFGWGDRGWYLSGGQFNIKSLPIVANALFLPSKSVMHVNTLQFNPHPSPKREKLYITHEQLDLLNQYIFNYFQVNRIDNTFIEIGEYVGFGYGDFYEGRGKYHMYYNSNNWTSRILKRMGIRNPVWAPFPHGIMYHIRRAKAKN
jgi:uncharacterized protein (TIGR02117 family)